MIKSYFVAAFSRVGDSIRSFDLRSIDLGNPWLQLLLILLAVLLLSFLIDLILSHTIFGRWYRIFVAPGVILHEVSHAFFCLITGAKIKSIALFDTEGGSVTHEQSKIPLIGPVLIAFAPLVIGIAAIYILSHSIGLRPDIVNILNIKYESVIQYLRSSFAYVKFDSYLNWLLVYVIFSIAITMTPSRQDLKNAIFSLSIIIFAIFLLIKFLGVHANLSFIPLDRLIIILSTVSILLIFAFVFSIIIFAITKVFKH